MNAVEILAAAIEKLEALTRERGVANGWLYEIDPNVTGPNEDPRIGLVEGGPDVMLMRTVAPQIDILREALGMITGYGDSDVKARQTYRFEVALAEAILGEVSL